MLIKVMYERVGDGYEKRKFSPSNYTIVNPSYTRVISKIKTLTYKMV